MLGLKLNHVSKRGHRWLTFMDINRTTCWVDTCLADPVTINTCPHWIRGEIHVLHPWLGSQQRGSIPTTRRYWHWRQRPGRGPCYGPINASMFIESMPVLSTPWMKVFPSSPWWWPHSAGVLIVNKLQTKILFTTLAPTAFLPIVYGHGTNLYFLWIINFLAFLTHILPLLRIGKHYIP